MDRKMIATSKWLAYMLRHAPESQHIRGLYNGWMRLAELERVGPYSDIEILSVLSADSKGRFEAFCSYGVFWVRATSGAAGPSPSALWMSSALLMDRRLPALPPHVIGGLCGGVGSGVGSGVGGGHATAASF